MANKLKPTIRAYMHDSDTSKRYIRIDEAARDYQIEVNDMEALAIAAGSLYRFPKISLIHKERLEEFMKHIYKVLGSNKQVEKKFVRIGEGSIIYSIGHHRFIEMARAAGATYKINEGTGGTVLINLEAFDEYMEQFRQKPVPMKNPLWKSEKEEDNQ